MPFVLRTSKSIECLHYVNDVLTRLMKGETDYKSLIPWNYKPLPKDDGEGQKEAA